ncbi:MAG: DUF58 domain-containing protein [Armatimonadetes bacterium]|nr:DUF58 domain-containing protein [Armatimonadota bacterium]
MRLTVLGLLLMLPAVALQLAGAYVPAAGAVGWAWLGLIAALAVLDAFWARGACRVELERLVPERLSLGVETQVGIRVRNRTPRSWRLVVKDDPPELFRQTGRERTVRLGPFEEGEIRYPLLPTRRGDFEFGDAHLRGTGRLGFCAWHKSVPLAAPTSVYPNLVQVDRYEALARADRLQQAGFRPLRIQGQGAEFESLREYIPDDEYGSIDWKASARRNRPIVRLYDIERSQTLMLMVDAGRMMTAEVGGLTKLDHAVNAALMLAHVASHTGDCVGMMAFGRTLKAFVPAGRGAAQVGRILDQLYAVQPALEEPDYDRAFAALAHRCRKRALVVLFSDLVDEDCSRSLMAHAGALRPRHLPLLVTLRDPDLEAVGRGVPADVNAAYERAVAADVLARRDAALATLRARGALVVDAPAGNLTVATVNQYLQLKARGML